MSVDIDDIYSETNVEEQMEDDLITAEEEEFMIGYMEEDQREKGEQELQGGVHNVRFDDGQEEALHGLGRIQEAC